MKLNVKSPDPEGLEGSEMATLTATMVEMTAESGDFADADHPLGVLCDRIVTKHHSYLRRELPRLGALLLRVTEAQSEQHSELPRLLELYGRFSGDMKRHLDVEEELLFPLIRQLDAREHSSSGSPGRIEMLVEDLVTEHESVSTILWDVRMLTRDFEIPCDACDTYRLILRELAGLERDLHEHHGLENNILFPRACQMEREC